MLEEATSSNWQLKVMAFYAAMETASGFLSDSDREELEEWDRTQAAEWGTSAWPKWKNYIPASLYIDFRKLIEEYRRSPKTRRGRKQAIPARLRQAVWERDNFTCQYCGSTTDLSIDHIVAESKGGDMSIENLQTLCRRCNSRKGAK